MCRRSCAQTSCMTRTAPITRHGNSLHMVDSRLNIIMHTRLRTNMTTDLHTYRAPAMHISVPTRDGGRTTIALRADEYRSMQSWHAAAALTAMHASPRRAGTPLKR